VNPVLEHWSLSVTALACYAVAATAHLSAVRNVLTRSDRGHEAGAVPRQPGLVKDALLVQAGLLVALMAVVSPLGYWSGAYLWIRAMQDLTLCFIAPALIVAGHPWLVLRPLRHQSGDLPEREATWSGVRPVLAVVIFNVAWLGWHVPAAFDLVQGNGSVRLAEHACYLGAGVWFWLQVAGPRRYGRWQPPLRRLALLTATAAAGTVLGMVLVFGANVVYPAYANSLHHVMTVLDDQQLSGAVLWMGMMPPVVIAGVALLIGWLNDEDSDVSADLSRFLRHRTSGWSVRPGPR
jgi:cytochrome c oxidase assembly factor CtaG